MLANHRHQVNISNLKVFIFILLTRLVNFSGNAMGDGGARLLAKALQINTRIKSIYYDRNNITLQGYCDLAYALER